MKVFIAGGGLSGLICGLRLLEKGFEIAIAEKNEELGGLARCFPYKNYWLPIFYHHIFAHDKVTLNVLKELKIEEFYKKRIKMGISFNNKIYEISWIKGLSWDFLSIKDKLKFGVLAFQTKVKKDWKELEGKNAEEWLIKKVGSNVTYKIFAPLMKEKYGLPLRKISAIELAERLKEGEATGTFLYPKKGLKEMIKRLEKKITKKGGKIYKKAEIKKIIIGRKHEIFFGKEKEKAEILINSLPVPVFLKISRNLPVTYKKRLEKIRYCSNICINFVYEEELSKYYWINTFDKVFGGIIEHTNLANKYPFKFAWVWKYAPSKKLWNMEKERLINVFYKDIKRIFPKFEYKEVFVFRDLYASPLYDVNYGKYMPKIETPIHNLFFTGVATTYPEIRTMNTAFKSGIKTAYTVASKFKKSCQ